MKENPLMLLGTLGQSVWLDFISRDLIASGRLKRLIEEDGLRGMTSNPSIFEQAIDGTRDYDGAISALVKEGKDAAAICDAVTRRDVTAAAAEFLPVYDRTDGLDGYVSLEVNPHLAHDTGATIAEARRLWAGLNRPNVFIKVPATIEGLPAIRELVTDGINVNITLLFGLPRYRAVADAFIDGIESRVSRGKPVGRVASVASFFVSRIDSLVDRRLDEIAARGDGDAGPAERLRGTVAIACAKLAYQDFKERFGGDRFRRLAAHGARAQRLLWASTGTKNPAYHDVKYIEELVGRDTISTIPVKTLDAYRDHGAPKPLLEQDAAGARLVMDQLARLGIDIGDVTARLEREGIDQFARQYDLLLETLTRKVSQARAVAK